MDSELIGDEEREPLKKGASPEEEAGISSGAVDSNSEERDGVYTTMDGAALELPLFVEIKEEPSSESDGDTQGYSLQSDTTTENSLADRSTLFEDDKSDSFDDFDSNDGLRDAVGEFPQTALDLSRRIPLQDAEGEKRLAQAKETARKREEHTGNKKQSRRPFRCEFCAKCFPAVRHLENHQRVHTGEKPFKCTVCEKAFAVTGNLMAHMRVHSGERPFNCTVCSKAFNKSSALNAHMRIHREEKPFKCDLCEKTFRSSSNLTRHVRTHKGERPFPCPDCGKCFSQSNHLSHHRRSVHKRTQSVNPSEGSTDVQK